MNKQDKSKFVQIMLGMADNFRDTITEEGMKMRFDMLSEFSIGQVEQAARKIMFTRKYTKMPPVAEFVEAIQGNNQQQIEDRAEVQATYVISCIGQDYPVFSDPVTSHLMSRRWRWNTWAPAVLESELKWWAKEFKDAYRAFSGSETTLQIEAAPEIKKLVATIGG